MAPNKQREWHPAFEEYCETIFELREDDVDVIQARIADRLEVSRPAVSEMIRRMEGADLVEIDELVARAKLLDRVLLIGQRIVAHVAVAVAVIGE